MAEQHRPDFAELLRRARRAAGLSQEALAERAGLSARAISALERGVNRAPRRDTLDMLADALDLPADERRRWERLRRSSRASMHTATPHRASPAQTAPMNLPAQQTSFIGRERDISRVVEMLRSEHGRLVTLTGPGGIGKTRLALQAATHLLDRFPDGVYFVDLAPISDPRLVLLAVAGVLQTRVRDDQPIVVTLAELLQDRRSLLVLDNLEHVLDAASDIAELLLRTAAVRILATSRAPLRLREEREYPVEPLPFPGGVDSGGVDALARSDAVRLFIERAQAVRPDFHLTPDNLAAIVETCVRLDGLPLAIELAAARVRLLPPPALLARLEQRLPLLTSSVRDIPARQRTLRDTIAWSYALLAPTEQQVFRTLSIFRGGWDLSAADALVGDAGDTLSAMDTLVGHSLIRVREGTSGEARYGMLETIREFGLEQLDAHGELADVARRHAQFYVEYARLASQRFGSSEHYEPMLRDIDNFRAAFAWGLAHDPLLTLRGAAALEWVWLPRGWLREGRRWLESAMSLGKDVPRADLARALDVAGTLAGWHGDTADGIAMLERAVRLYQDEGHRAGVARALFNLARTVYFTGDTARAQRLNEESLALTRQSGDRLLESAVLGNLGIVLRALGQIDASNETVEQALALARENNTTFGVLIWLSNLAHHHAEDGDFVQAKVRLREALPLSRSLGEMRFAIENLEDVAIVITEANPVLAVQLFGAAAALRETVGYPVFAVHRPTYQADLAHAREGLTQAAGEAAWEAGRRLSMPEASALALDALGDDRVVS